MKVSLPLFMQPSQSEDNGAAEGQRALTRLVIKNTFYLTAAQALTIPLAVVVNAAMARYLGAADFGLIYLAATVCSFGFLAVNWGHEGVLPAILAQDRTQSGALFLSSVVWRIAMAALVYIGLAAGCHFIGYGGDFQWALALTCLVGTLNSLLSAGKDTIRGFERTDIPAYAHVSQQLLVAAFVVPVLILGGRMRAALFIQALPAMIVLVFTWRALRSVGVGTLQVSRSASRSLFRGGVPFVFFGLAMALQPNIDAIFLSKLAPEEVMGWFAVSRRLIGVLVFPASALIGALYPTLCRLRLEDKAEFLRVSRGAFYGVALLVVPVALGCGLYPDIGIAIFSRKYFGPAAENLRVLSVFLLLVYFSMPLGTCVIAAGKERTWSIVQCLCVLVSLILDPILVPWFQHRTGNGGLGICIASVVSEAVVVACGIVLVPRGVFDRRLAKALFLAFVAGGAMALVAWVTRSVLTPYLAAPLSVLAYGVALWFTGVLDASMIDAARAFVQRKFSRS